VGVLDDAIREHLELKRRHGAGEDEVRRQEAEALGPARREPALREPEEPVGAVPVEEVGFAKAERAPFEPPHGAEPALGHEHGDERVAADEVPVEESLDAPPAEVDADREARALDEEELAEEELAAELAGDEVVKEEPAEDLPPEEPAEDLPAEEPAEDLPPEEPAGPDEADEDVLEETPEFLQETPEHERLWFEQKPPRDFDLDR
jgi:hypothetical protein